MLFLSGKCINVHFKCLRTCVNPFFLYVSVMWTQTENSFAYCVIEKIKKWLELDLVGGSMECYLTTDQKHSNGADIINMLSHSVSPDIHRYSLGVYKKRNFCSNSCMLPSNLNLLYITVNTLLMCYLSPHPVHMLGSCLSSKHGEDSGSAAHIKNNLILKNVFIVVHGVPISQRPHLIL